MNIASILILAVIAALVTAAVIFISKHRNSGRCQGCTSKHCPLKPKH